MLKPAFKMSQKLHKPQNVNVKPVITNKRPQTHLLAPPPTPEKRLNSQQQQQQQQQTPSSEVLSSTSTSKSTSSSSTSSSVTSNNLTASTTSSSSPHFPDHLRCGEVFTWHCEGEFYAVECRLCDDHPLCPLSEFPLHMEAWHTDWSGKLTIDGEELEAEDEADEEEQNDLYHVLALSPLNEDSGLCEYDHEHSSYTNTTTASNIGGGGGGGKIHNSSLKTCDDEENLLEPFEQVLIEQDNTVDTTQINDDDEDNGDNDNDDDDEEEEVLNEIAGEEAPMETETTNDEKTLTVAAIASSSASASTSECQQQIVANKSKQKPLLITTHHEKLLSPAKNTQLNHPTKLSYQQNRIEEKQQPEDEENNNRREIKEFDDHRLTKLSESQMHLKMITKENENNSNNNNNNNNNATNHISPGSWDVSQGDKESCSTPEKQEIQAGEIVQMPSPTTRQADLQHYKISSNFVESNQVNKMVTTTTTTSEERSLIISDLTKKLPANVEITKVEIINGPLNIAPPSITTTTTTTTNTTTTPAPTPTTTPATTTTTTTNLKTKISKDATNKRKRISVTEESESNASPAPSTDFKSLSPCSDTQFSSDASLSPANKDKYFKSFEKFLDSTKLPTETETDNSAESIDEAYCSPSSKSPKKRRTLSRACKKSTTEQKAKTTKTSPSHLKNIVSSGTTSGSESTTSSSTCLSLPEALGNDAAANTCEKASKIRCLVKQCERIAREHKQAKQVVETDSIPAKSSPSNARKKSRRRRSLTPVEVCDILPTIPLNDYTITYYDTENMSPESLSEHLESLACSLLDYDDFPDDDQSVHSNPSTDDIIGSSPSSPGSPKTEEEHFEFTEPKEKLNRTHVLELIEFYKEHTRLWDQSHTEFCEPHLCRESWQDITKRWNVFCNRNFTITEVRIRISTLCQRYLKERERIQREGELDESAKFPYYEQMLFLEQHRSLQKRREIYEQQNEKILEIYRKHLVLWHVRCYKVRQVKERTQAFQRISDELKEMGIYLSSAGVQKRIRSLRKCYRLEKIRHLHAQVERLAFEPTFKHYERMQFLDKHIDPFVCRICGKIFESLVGFKEHVETVNHGNILEEEDEDEEQGLMGAELLPVEEKDAVVCGVNEKYEISMGTKDGNSVSVFIKPLSVAEEVEIYTSETGCDNTLSKLPMEDSIIEKLIANVANESDFATKTLDKYLHSNDNTEDMTFYMESANVSLAELIMPERVGKQVANEGFPYDGAIDDLGMEKKTEVIPKFEGVTKYSKTKAYTIDEEYHSGDGDTTSTRLNDDEIRCMISLYRKYRQLWDPNHLDYNSRSLRRQAWFNLTTEYNRAINRNFSWRSLYRKLIDYAKYYKKLSSENSQPHEVKWTFFRDLMFLDDVIAVNNELQKSMHLRDITLKVIEIYKNLPQLWNIRDPDFNKRPVKQRNMNVLCNRVQEETNMQINPERIKNRIIELRTAYRAAKKKRMKCAKTKQKFFADFEFYEEFNFIDPHIDPFQCDLCCMDFKKLTDFNRHIRTEHEPKRRRFRSDPEKANNEDEVRTFENVCHICGVKFSNRGNLAHHLQRHEGTKNFECSMCPKKFYTSHALKIHVRTHTKECPYICEKCGLSFVNASKLNQHVLRHTNKKDFKCDHCPKTFYTAFEKNRHTRWHLNIRDKNCPICGKSFVRGSSYYAHLMLHSDKKRFECDKCDTKFAQYAGLYKHKKRYHST